MAGHARAAARFRVQLDPAAVQLDQALDQRQTEAGAAVAALAPGALELAEHALDIFLADADAGIGHDQANLRIGALHRGGHHAARGRELDRVGQEVEQRLPEAPAIGHQGADVLGAVDLQRDALMVRALVGERLDAVEQRAQVDRGDLELQIAGLDGGQIQDIVDQRGQALRGHHDAAAVLQLALIELAEVLVLQDLGEADDGVQGRAQLVGDVGDELGFQPVRRLHRLGALAQRALDPDRVGDVQEGEQRGPVGQRQERPVDDGTVGALAPAAARLWLGRPRHPGLHDALPLFVGDLEEVARPRDQLAHVRLAAEQVLRQVPDPGEGRIGQLEPAVGAVDRNAFVEIVQGLALDLDQRVVGAFQGQPVGHVLVGEQHAAHGVRAGDAAQRAAVGQMEQLLERLDQPLQPAQPLAFVLGEVDLLGQAARLAQGLQATLLHRVGQVADQIRAQQHEDGREGDHKDQAELSQYASVIHGVGGGARFVPYLEGRYACRGPGTPDCSLPAYLKPGMPT